MPLAGNCALPGPTLLDFVDALCVHNSDVWLTAGSGWWTLMLTGSMMQSLFLRVLEMTLLGIPADSVMVLGMDEVYFEVVMKKTINKDYLHDCLLDLSLKGLRGSNHC